MPKSPAPGAWPAARTHWPLGTVCTLVQPWLPGLQAEAVASIDSTSSELMRRLRGGDGAHAHLLVAESQSAGRGRQGRTWHDAQDPSPDPSVRPASLMFSLSRPLAPAQWSGLSLALGVALAEALHPAIGLKWPNDLWWQGRKVGGILVETAHVAAHRSVVVGIGLNVRQPAVQGLTVAAAWTEEFLSDDAAQLLMRLMPGVAQALDQFERLGLEPFRAAFSARDALRGQPVWLSDGTHGTAHGIDEVGGLLVHTAAGMKSVISQEVSVRTDPGGSAAHDRSGD